MICTVLLGKRGKAAVVAPQVKAASVGEVLFGVLAGLEEEKGQGLPRGTAHTLYFTLEATGSLLGLAGGRLG